MATLPSKKWLLATSSLILLIGAVIFFALTKKESIPFENPWPKSRFALLKVLALTEKQPQQQTDSARVALGHRLFFDTELNSPSNLGCVSCHQPALAFSDGLKHPKGNPLKRNSAGLLGIAKHSWFFWDGRKDSLWSQALEPFYASHEIALTPTTLLKALDSSPRYRALYTTAFGPWPQPLPQPSSADGILLQAHIGLSIEAFISELQHQSTPFDQYIYALEREDLQQANSWLNQEQRAGLRVMLRSNCISCHRGAGFSDSQFQNIGTGDLDSGRATGKQQWLADTFNCESEVAKDINRKCKLHTLGGSEITALLNGAFKTPSLRELTHTAPYMHDGRYQTLAEVIEHYRNPPTSKHGLADIPPISDREAAQLSAFLEALSSPIEAKAWYNRSPRD